MLWKRLVAALIKMPVANATTILPPIADMGNHELLHEATQVAIALGP